MQDYLDIPVFNGKENEPIETLFHRKLINYRKCSKTNLNIGDKFSERMDFCYIKPFNYLQYRWFEYVNVGGKIIPERFEKTNSFNEDTGELIEEFDLKDIRLNNFSYEVVAFSLSILKKHKYAYETLGSVNPKLNSSRNTNHCLFNFYTLCVKYPTILEQSIKQSPGSLYSFLESNIEFKSSFKKTVELPDSFISTMNKLLLGPLIPECRILSDKIDGNDFNVFGNFLSNLQKIFKKKENYFDLSYLSKLMIDNLNKIITTDPQISLTHALEYILKQAYYHNKFLEDSSVISSITKLFSDYTNLRIIVGYGERYPSELVRAHNTIKLNGVEVDQQVEDNFNKNVSLYSSLEKEFIYDEQRYIVKAPSCIKDLIKEGDSLNHCVGGYVNLIATGLSRVLFLRKKEQPEESYITFEIDKDLNVGHSAGINNSELSLEEKNILIVWETAVKKERKNNNGNKTV